MQFKLLLTFFSSLIVTTPRITENIGMHCHIHMCDKLVSPILAFNIVSSIFKNLWPIFVVNFKKKIANYCRLYLSIIFQNLVPIFVVHICRQFSNICCHLIVSASDQALPINLLYVVAHLVTEKNCQNQIFNLWRNKKNWGTSMYGMLLIMLPSLILLMKA